MMDKNEFINHQNPTTPIDLSQISLEQQYTNLTQEEKDLLVCKFLGMNHKPVDIITFVSDDYFLGHPGITNHGNAVFQYWKDNLVKMFPSPLINKYCYISFGGCIGSGKLLPSVKIKLQSMSK